MNEDTTTITQDEKVVDEDIDSYDDESQATETTETAGESTEEAQSDTKSGETESVDSTADTDEDLDYLKAKGIDPSDPQALSKAAKMYRNAEKDMTRRRQDDAKGKLREAAHTAADGDQDQELKNEVRVMRFWQDNPEAKPLEADIAEMLQTRPTYRPDGSVDLDAAYDAVVAKRAKDDIKAAEARGREAAKREIAKSSKAAMPAGNAAGNAPKGAKDSDLEEFDKEFDKY